MFGIGNSLVTQIDRDFLSLRRTLIGCFVWLLMIDNDANDYLRQHYQVLRDFLPILQDTFTVGRVVMAFDIRLFLQTHVALLLHFRHS